jgi:hypothetical protein
VWRWSASHDADVLARSGLDGKMLGRFALKASAAKLLA